MRISKSKFVKLISIKEHECKALEEYLEEKALEGVDARGYNMWIFNI